MWKKCKKAPQKNEVFVKIELFNKHQPKLRIAENRIIEAK